MNFPIILKRRNKPTLPDIRIHRKNYMYARHKPGSEWKIGDDYPDFSKIKSDQSFNWSAYSIPAWVRFTENRELKNDYGVLGYSVNTIKGLTTKNNNLCNLYDLTHKPLEYNYSHCELKEKIPVNRPLKREWRMNLVHGCCRYLYPYQKSYAIFRLLNHFTMYFHRFISRFLK